MRRTFLGPFRSTTGLARWILVTGLFITLVFLVMAVFAPWVAPYDFDQRSVGGVKLPKMAPPSNDHWFGTNDQFYDVYSRVIWGARTALVVVDLQNDFADPKGTLEKQLNQVLSDSIKVKVLEETADTIYEVPLLFHQQHLESFLLQQLA